MEFVNLPQGLLRWREDFELSDNEICFAFKSAQSCSSLAANKVFQYKILTQILPTRKYLARFKVINSNRCERCNIEVDSIMHCLWSCEAVHPYVERIIYYLENECSVSASMLSEKAYIFGCPNKGVNHVFLELKKEMFYNKDLISDLPTFCEYFFSKIRKIMSKEKNIMLAKDNYEGFDRKWSNFKSIYDYCGPDIQLI